MLFLVLILAFCLLPSSVSAQGESANGAAHVNLVEVVINPGPPITIENGDAVGSVLLNTTADRKLIVNLNMDTKPNLEDYDIIINVFYTPPPLPPTPLGTPDIVEIFPDKLDTNSKGQGNVQVQLDINPPPTNDMIWVIVNVREGPTDPPTPPAYRLEEPAVVPLKPANSKGAIKVDLVEFANPSNKVGSVILNTTASGKLIVNVDFDTEPNLEDYDIIVFARYYPLPWPPQLPPPAPPLGPIGAFADVIDTNAQGQGNATVIVDLDPSPTNESSCWVIVNIREGPSQLPTPPVYTIGEGVPVEVPLK